MELIKKKIYLEDYIDRSDNSKTYGQITATTFYLSVFLTQSVDDMGIFTNVVYTPKTNSSTVDYTILINKLEGLNIYFPFMDGILPKTSEININPTSRVTGKTEADYYTNYTYKVSGITEPRLWDVRSYNKNNQYSVGLDINNEEYKNYKNEEINGVDRVIRTTPTLKYVFDADKLDQNIGTENQKNGFLFTDINGSSSTILYNGEGFNETNLSLSATTKEEYLFGITSKPEIKNDVFIDRGITKVFERHLRLFEVKNLGELVKYQNNYFRVSKF
jgi:hypothetical protein